MTKWPKSEVELARALVDDLQSRGWTVYQEVEVIPRGPRADIVAELGRVLWVIETKRSLGLQVLAQADHWVGKANLVSVAVPRGRWSSARSFACKAARSSGIGVLELQHHIALCAEPEHVVVREAVRPSFARRVPASLRRALTEEHKTFAEAGNAEGRRITHFSRTAGLVTARLRRAGNPMTPREVVDSLGTLHHYASEASARGSLLKAAQEGLLPGVRAQKVEGRWMLSCEGKR